MIDWFAFVVGVIIALICTFMILYVFDIPLEDGIGTFDCAFLPRRGRRQSSSNILEPQCSRPVFYRSFIDCSYMGRDQ
jgi:hypothetical protein